MKTNRELARWLGLALAVGVLTIAATTQAAKPPKPPSPPPPPALTYTLVPFENGQGLGSTALGITEAGLVPGRYEYQEAIDSVTYQFIWPTVATRTDVNGDGVLDPPTALPVLDGHVTGYAWRANESGLIVGETERFVPDSEWPPLTVFAQAVLWLPGQGAYTPMGLGVIDRRLHQSQAAGINSSGVVVGGCTWGNTINWHRSFIIVPAQTEAGAIWSKDLDGDGVNDLMLPIWPGPDPRRTTGPVNQEDEWSLPPQDPVARITGLNDAGVLCGTIDFPGGITPDPRGPFVVIPDYDDSDGDRNPWFKADAAGNNLLVRKLPALRAGAYSVANAINAGGQVGGVSDNHAVLWKPAAGGSYVLQDLGRVTGRDHMQVTALSDTGWMVGYGYNSLVARGNWPANMKPDIAAVWRNGVMYLVPDVLANGTGWSDLHFYDVSDTGILAGYGVFNGKRTACLAVPNPQ